MLGSNRKLDLSGQGLTMMHHTELLPLLMELNLSSNSLSETPGFSFLHCLVHLNLAGNKLKSCRGLSRLPCLQSLDLSKNRILVHVGVSNSELGKISRELGVRSSVVLQQSTRLRDRTDIGQASNWFFSATVISSGYTFSYICSYLS